MTKLSVEQNLLLFIISHQYVLINNDGEMEEDSKKALCGTFVANKFNYNLPALLKDITYLEQNQLIEKSSKDKRYDITAIGKSDPSLIISDEKRGSQNFPPIYDSFIRTYWALFCSFLRVPLVEILKEIGHSENKVFTDLSTTSDIATTVLVDLAIKRGYVERDPKSGIVSLTDSGKELIKSQM